MSDSYNAQPEATPEAAAPLPAADTPAPAEQHTDTIEQEMSRVYDKTNAATIPNESAFQLAMPEVPEGREGEKPTEALDAEGEPLAEAVDEPATLPKQLKALWAKLSPEWQEWISERESQARGKIGELGRASAEAAKLAEPFNAVTEKWQHVIPKMPDGKPMPAHTVMEHWAAAEHILQTNPQAGLQWLARHYGVDLAELGRDPQAETRRQQTEAWHKAQLAAQAWQEISAQLNQRGVAVVTDFFKGKEDHWSEIEQDIVDHAAAIRSRDQEMHHRDVLQLAYDRAVAGNKSLSDRLSAGKNKEAKSKAEAEARRKAAEAKRLASLNVGGNRHGVAAGIKGDLSKPGAMEDSMSEIFERIRARG